jgi:hypothetical protein
VNLKSFLVAFLGLAPISVGLSAPEGVKPSPNTFLATVGEGPLDSSIGSSAPALELRANQDASKVSIRVGGTKSLASLDTPGVVSCGRFVVTSLTASAPLTKNSDQTTLAALDGLANAFTLEFKFTHFWEPRRNPTDADDATVIMWLAEAKRKKDPTLTLEAAKHSIESWDTEAVAKNAPEHIDDYNLMFWDWPKIAAGCTAKVGQQKYTFLQPTTLADGDVQKIPYGAGLFFGIIPSNKSGLITLGFEYQNAYKDAKSKSFALPVTGGGPQEVKAGPLGEPEQDDKRILSIEFRRLLRLPGMEKPSGITLKTSYDVKSYDFSARLPLYFVRDSKSKLTGGVELGWRKSTHRVTFGVIVGGAFGLY